MIIVKKYKPTSPGIRGLVSLKNNDLYKGKPFKKLTVFKKCSSGRNNTGRITVWNRGGGHKRKYRIIDWLRNKYNIVGKIERIEYDPNRTAYIALVLYEDGDRRYILYPNGLKVNDQIISGTNCFIKVGNKLPIENIPLGTHVHCVEMVPGTGAKIARSAGTFAQVLSKSEKHAVLRLRSGELRKVLLSCHAVIGEVGKSEHNLQKLGKAGRSRWKNMRPRVRGVAMNPVDHPMGGGEGRSSGGRNPCSPWGLPEGTATRRLYKRGFKLIVKRRNG